MGTGPKTAYRYLARCPQWSPAVPGEPVLYPWYSLGGQSFLSKRLFPHGVPPVCIHLLDRNVGTLAAVGVGKGGVQEDLPVPLEQRLSLQVKSFPLTLGKACKLWGQADWEYETLTIPPYWRSYSLSPIPGGFPLVSYIWYGTDNGMASLEALGSHWACLSWVLGASTSGSALWTFCVPQLPLPWHPLSHT